MRSAVAILIVLIAAADLAWNLTHLNIGLVDFYGLSTFARGLVENGAWPATPYFPAGYPLLISFAGLLGSALGGGYVLAAFGLGLALWSVYRLAAEFKLNHGLRITAFVLVALLPVYRIAAGSPSVDSLYTGLGMWMLAAAVSLWRHPGGKAPRWVVAGLLFPALFLPLLRYHSLLLVLPLVIVLLLLRPQHRRLAGTALALCIFTLVFNYVSWGISYGGRMPSVAGLQLRCGIEFDYNTNYATPRDLFADYPAFVEHARVTPFFTDYSAAQLIGHTAKSFWRYIKQPPVLLALLLLAYALVRRRKLPQGATVAALWIVCYVLALSPGYFTVRAALLPSMLAVVLCLVYAQHLTARRSVHFVFAGVIVLLLAGYLKAADYATLDYRQRVRFAEISERVDDLVQEHDAERHEVIASDWRIMPLYGNRWCSPYSVLDASWISDPSIRPEQRAGLTTLGVNEIASGLALVELLVLQEGSPAELRARPDSELWERIEKIDEFHVYARRPGR